MKKVLFLCLIAVVAASCNTVTDADALSPEKAIQAATMDTPRFKMIETDNFHILLKWDTRTGKTWMVQYSLPDTPALENFIPRSNIITEEEGWNGRFELYPTKNMFNFIMVDTYNGNTYQVQWGTDSEYCFTSPITGNN